MFLGLAEAGYIPGACYTLSTWYKKKELAKRVAVFFFGMFSGNALSPLLASGILKLEGARGLRGWQWLFLIEGVFTIFVGLSLLFLLPGSPDTPDPLLSRGLVRFKGSERAIIQRRLEFDDKEKRHGAQGMHIPPKLVLKTILHWQRWPHFLSSFAVFSTWSPLTTYTPTIIMQVAQNLGRRHCANQESCRNLGFNRIQANALAAVGASLALVVVFIVAWISDKTNKRGLSYYRGNDTPFYQTGLRTQIIMVSIGMGFAILQVIIYTLHNKRVAEGKYKPAKGEVPRIYVP
ncbi:hypothetical protein N0V92_000062 [Colletotrichum tropicale]|nr:hypothetical protein N0V92_000062 [Colletotrichum tropicale]